ncbi:MULTISPECIES: helix-turn-helix transcriptional regulator [Sphingomonadaceae]|uniref:Helix-turn-helix transcriptional regulator n=1 Tax=Novosphingobium clariflavum TaxID=2029884 RepID=A0ABV6S9S4_9SPHN|nr:MULTISPECIES: S24 family peptidase [Sphingomonadaceae]QDK32373.1 transcriptional regulator [Sphingomonas sp. IC081]QSR18717.1 transcriptional regulator [Novosphingobium sp. KA1]
METPDPRSRLLQLADARGVSLSSLSRMIGKNASYLQQFIKKGSPRKLEEQDRSLLARFFGVDEVELGKGGEKSYDLTGWVDVPRLAVGASAGPGAHAGEEETFGTLRFTARWLRSLGLRPDALSAISVTGDSMEPTLRHGDEILVDRDWQPLRDGIHVVRLDDAVLVKRLEPVGAGRIALLSDNPAYRVIECGLDDVVVIGRVVWKGGRI